MRSTLLRLHQEDHVLLLAMHHIISDGWSLGIFFGELAALYAECNGGARAVLPELPLRYVDFAAWQRERLSTGGLERQLSYWRERLTGATALDLPLDYPRPAMQTFSGASISATLPAELASALRNLARSENATLFVTLLAAFQVLLSRHAGQEDIVIGTPMAGRSRRELENLIGLFVNTVVVRTDLSGSPTFRELLRRTKETVLGAYENQDVPFETLIEILNPERDLSRSPLFQVLFNMISFVDQPLTLAALAVERVASPEIRSKFDLTLYAGEDNETLSLLLLYNPDLFCCERMTDWLRQFHNLLWQIVEDPDRPTSHYSPEPRCGSASPQSFGGAPQEMGRQRPRALAPSPPKTPMVSPSFRETNAGHTASLIPLAISWRIVCTLTRLAAVISLQSMRLAAPLSFPRFWESSRPELHS